MSGSSGSSGGIGFSSGASSCDSLVITTQLDSPKPAVVERIAVGDELDVRTMQMGSTTTVVAMLNNEPLAKGALRGGFFAAGGKGGGCGRPFLA